MNTIRIAVAVSFLAARLASASTIPVTGHVVTSVILWDHGTYTTAITQVGFHFEGPNFAADGYNIYTMLPLEHSSAAITPASIRLIIYGTENHPEVAPASFTAGGVWATRVLIGNTSYRWYSITMEGTASGPWTGTLTIYADAALTQVKQIFTLSTNKAAISHTSDINQETWQADLGGKQSLGGIAPSFE
jgi:hypothetical protein